VLLAHPLEGQSPSLVWQPLSSRTYDGRAIAAEAAKLEVPENRATPGRTISLGLIRLPATSSAAGDPIVFLMGGPGIPASVMLPIPPYFDLFDRLRALGDVILVDQRGVGQSEPVVSCPSKGPLPTDFLSTRRRAVDALREVTSACLVEWRERGVNIGAYNTRESSDDLESLRVALGARRLNLLAFSYGTHLALSYARRYPDGVGRMVLQGVRGPDQSLKSPEVYARGFHQLSRLAAEDSTARSLAPDIEQLLGATLDRLTPSPIQVSVTDPAGAPVAIIIGKEGLQLLVSNAPDDPRLPALLASLAKGDSTLLAQVASAAWQGLGEVNLMARAVDCASGSSAAARERVSHEVAGALLGNPAPNLVRLPDYCEVFGDIALPEEFRSPITSAAPTLFISGQLDVQAPAEEAAAVARGFSRGVELIVANGRHELLPITAVRAVVVDFFAGRDVAGRALTADPPGWVGMEEAKSPPRRR
jgi:pimeloyl-ACP methyl ester carboxylesterase